MSETADFERVWLTKFADCLDELAGEEIRKQVMQGSEGLASASPHQEVIAWSKRAIERLEALVDKETSRQIMTGCACQYPKSELRGAREAYAATKDVNTVHHMLQEQFEGFLRDSLGLDDEMVAEIAQRGWGLAGIKSGNSIIATKIPKSGYLVEYMEETDPDRKRQYYCHCPRVRDALKTSETISATYCYCGAGFYKGVWEEILQKPVHMEVLETVLKGDEVCKIAIHLPAHV